MHEGQLVLTEETAARVIAQRFPVLAHLPVERVRTTGTVNTIVRIGDDFTARFPLVTESAETLAAEAAAMEELADVCVVPSPRSLGIGAATPEYPSAWSVQTWVPGETASHDLHATSDPLACEVATLIASLRAADVRGRKFDGRGRGGVLSDHDEWVALCIERSAHLVDAARVRRLWRALRDLPRSGPDVMSHRDLTPFNLLVSGDRLAGWHLFDAPRRRLLREHVGASDVEWQRAAGWALQQAMGLGWYYEDSNPAMSALGLSTMRRLLDDAELTSLG
ncbi:phosphotransferase [Microbacterium sp. K2]|uniref:phosphotransferase n=1 Tax=Microbacterium sp. K2 TaxID=3391827 RepID=UPI003ED897BC